MIPDGRAEERDLEDEAQLATSAELVEALYGNLKVLAHRERARVGRPVTLQTTALLHEAYLKLHRHPLWNDREHFLRAAAKAMRHVLVDSARARLRQKRGAGEAAQSLESAEHADQMPDDTVVELGEAMDRLSRLDPRLASVVECRFFAGYTDEQTAQALRLTDRTVRRDWTKAKAWLYRELRSSPA